MQRRVQLKCNPKCNIECNLTCTILRIFMEIAKYILMCTIKFTLRCTPWLHCQVDHQLGIFFFTILCIAPKSEILGVLKCNIE